MQQLIKTYYRRAEKQFAKDADRLAREGWLVQSHSATRHWLSTRITAVYTRAGEPLLHHVEPPHRHLGRLVFPSP